VDLLLVDDTGRLPREGKASISSEIAAIFDRLGSTADTWHGRMLRLRSVGILGRFLAAGRARLQDVFTKVTVLWAQFLLNLRLSCQASKGFEE
jgi:hypothetical protein